MKSLKEYRLEKGWTQGELAAELHVSDQAVSVWESGAGEPRPRMYPEIARVLGITERQARESILAHKPESADSSK